MGACLAVAQSGQPLMETKDVDGTEKEYQEKFVEEELLGSGSFGEVKKVFYKDPSISDEPFACKILHKGMQFKGNTLYTPTNRSALRAECVIMRTLQGKHHTIKLGGLYENSSYLWLIMEYCGGGEMMEYIVKQEEDLRTEDVSRISYELLDALNHCELNGVIHRDLKPENIMFKHNKRGASLRLIDFGSSCIASETEKDKEEKPFIDDNGIPLIQHSTFAGSGFYISPELFQRTYTYKTDLWSAGVTLYVLVAGFPAEKLQKAFKTLHTSKDRDLRSLPGLEGEELPDSYFDMLDELLRYRHKQRKCAKVMLEHEFVQFHKKLEEGGDAVEEREDTTTKLDDSKKAADAAAALGQPKRMIRKTRSVVLRGSVARHTMYMDYKKFERSVTTLLATILNKNQLDLLIDELKTSIQDQNGHEDEDSKLQSIKIAELKDILKTLELTEALEKMNQLSNINSYKDFSYRVPLLVEVAKQRPTTEGAKTMNNKKVSSTIPLRATQSVAVIQIDKDQLDLNNDDEKKEDTGNKEQPERAIEVPAKSDPITTTSRSISSRF